MRSIGFSCSNSIVDKISVIPPVDFQHVLCVGTTGSGKTASVIMPTLEDRIKRGHTVILLDHKGHEHKKVKYLAEKVGRLGDVVEIGKPHASYINLLNELNINRLKEVIKEDNRSNDPYWSNSAANLVEDIMIPLYKLHNIVQLLKTNEAFSEIYRSAILEMQGFGINLEQQPSFQTISRIVATPKRLIEYKKILSSTAGKLERMLQSGTQMYEIYHGKELIFRRELMGKIISLQKAIDKTERFTLSEDDSVASTGNNGVLQVLDNAIASYAKKDYINIAQYTMSELMDSNAIIIIDTQSFGEDIMKVFLESLLKKAVMRLRTGSESAMSVFIDEANRVLFPSIDLHSDVLREAKVELILAIQNEEQMILKFTAIKWESIRRNIKHQYFIDVHHKLSYNNSAGMYCEPLLLENNSLFSSEQSYYKLQKNRVNIEQSFLGEVDVLPKTFTVIYDIDMFEHESSILIEDGEGEKFILRYFGADVVNAVLKAYPACDIDFDFEDMKERKVDKKNSKKAPRLSFTRGLFGEDEIEDGILDKKKRNDMGF